MPARTAYDQWARFEGFPDFMDDVVEVRRIDEVRLHWVAVIDGERREWDAEITEAEILEALAEAGDPEALQVTRWEG